MCFCIYWYALCIGKEGYAVAKEEQSLEPKQEESTQHLRAPLVFPAGDLDAMIFHEEYAVEHSQR